MRTCPVRTHMQKGVEHRNGDRARTRLIHVLFTLHYHVILRKSRIRYYLDAIISIKSFYSLFYENIFIYP